MPAERQSIRSSLTVIGDRDYIQGIAILDALADMVASHMAHGDVEEIHIGLAKFNFKTLDDGVFVMRPGSDADVPDGRISAEIEGEMSPGGDTFKGYFIPDPATPATGWQEHDDLNIENVQSDQNHGGQCRVSWQGQTQFLKSLVEANKKIILDGLPVGAAKHVVDIVYLENLRIPQNPPAFSGVLSVRNMSARGKTNDVYVRNELCWGDSVKASTRFVFRVQSVIQGQ